jgi:hypothetical protein
MFGITVRNTIDYILLNLIFVKYLGSKDIGSVTRLQRAI